MTTGKNTALYFTWSFVSKLMSLLFNTLSSFVIVLLPGSKQVFVCLFVCFNFSLNCSSEHIKGVNLKKINTSRNQQEEFPIVWTWTSIYKALKIRVSSVFFYWAYYLGIKILLFVTKSWLQSLSAVILKPKKIVCHCTPCFPIYLPQSDDTRCQDLHFLSVKF